MQLLELQNRRMEKERTKTSEIPVASVLGVAEVVPIKTHFPLHTPISLTQPHLWQRSVAQHLGGTGRVQGQPGLPEALPQNKQGAGACRDSFWSPGTGISGGYLMCSCPP